jgi:uncharacterized protein
LRSLWAIALLILYQEETDVLGTLVNTAAIIAGSLLGVLIRSGIKSNYRQTVMQAVSVAIILIGLKGALQTADLLLVIVSLALGSIIGEFMQIEERLNAMGRAIERRVATQGEGVAQGFVTCSLMFCTGAMAIVGSLESGLAGNHQTLFAKSILDGMIALLFASTMGIGVLFSAFSVLIYQGLITLGAGMIQPLLTETVIAQMSAVGGLLIVALGFTMLEIKAIRVGNMLPAIFVPLFYYAIRVMLA